MIDPVDRGAVINELRACAIEAATLYGTNDALKTAFKESLRGINNLPNVEAERKRGTWEKVKGIEGAYDFRCSACHRFRFHNGEYLRKYNFCPNCGADMKGDRDG